ncbi:MAG TPA: hypothetical protein PK280_06755 [Planctomycetota bacterium]|nr:hypothetical protein [Planctomycetota bacterium]
MSAAAWILMTGTWLVIVGLLAYTLWRTFRARGLEHRDQSAGRGPSDR